MTRDMYKKRFHIGRPVRQFGGINSTWLFGDSHDIPTLPCHLLVDRDRQLGTPAVHFA